MIGDNDGDYTAPNTPFVVGAGNQDWLDQWVGGEALMRNRLLVSSFSGGGVLYAWDLATKQWSERANPNNDAPSAIACHPVYDLTFGLRVGPYAAVPYSLNRYDATGTLIGSVPVALSVIGYSGEPQQLYALGSRLVHTGPGRRISGIAVRHGYVIEPLTGDVVAPAS